MMQNKINRITIASLVLLCALPVTAAPQPDAGQTIRELQKQPEMSVPKPTTPLQPQETAPSKTVPGGNVRMVVRGFHVSGSSVFSETELVNLLADLVGGERTLAELNAGAARITAHYHERGYIIARAYIPAQDIKDGMVIINVQEGQIGGLQINNQSRISNRCAEEYFAVIKSGDVLRAAPVERALLLLNETPGVGGARAALQPGASAGSSDIVVELLSAEPYTANVYVDNFGNYYTGENRLGAELAFNSPLGIGDQVTLRALTSDQSLVYGYVAYQAPVSGMGLRLGVAYADTQYRLGKELAGSKSSGSATIASLFAVYPFIRSQSSNLTGTLTWEDKQLGDVIASTHFDKQVLAETLGLTGSHRDVFGGGGITLVDWSVTTGSLSMDAASLLQDSLSHTNGTFTRFNYSINRLQRLNDSYSLSLALSGQRSNKNLNSSEQFALGGTYGVRAYPQGEAYGDQGRLATVELRHNFTQTLQGVIFYDAGFITVNHYPYLPGANTRFISGEGVGENADVGGFQVKAYLALRARGGQPTSEPAVRSSNYRLWVQVGKQF